MMGWSARAIDGNVARAARTSSEERLMKRSVVDLG
jgi:hypothetical protein